MLYLSYDLLIDSQPLWIDPCGGGSLEDTTDEETDYSDYTSKEYIFPIVLQANIALDFANSFKEIYVSM